MKSVIYSRISPTKRDETDDDMAKSIKSAIGICSRKLKENNDELIHTYIDQYVSGKSQKYMKAFQQLMNDARDHQFERIYIRRVDRFGRNLEQMIEAETELHRSSIGIYSVEENLDTSTQIGRLFMHMMSHLSEWKRLEILENFERGRREAIARGVKFGRKHSDIDIKATTALIDNTNMTMKQIATNQKVSVATLYRRLSDDGYKFTRLLEKK